MSDSKTPWKLPKLAGDVRWHRPDWKEEWLPEGYRPLLDDEKPVIGDEILMFSDWDKQSAVALMTLAGEGQFPQRTSRPLPDDVWYADLPSVPQKGKRLRKLEL